MLQFFSAFFIVSFIFKWQFRIVNVLKLNSSAHTRALMKMCAMVLNVSFQVGQTAILW